MNVLDSELSSGCESGWTLYLEHSHCSYSPSSSQKDELFVGNKRGPIVVDGEEEDLSMVSDASSGPPHFHEDDDDYDRSCNGDEDGYSITHPPIAAAATTVFAKSSCRRQKKIKYRGRYSTQESFLLDDTASSPLFSFKNNDLIKFKEKQTSMGSLIDDSQSQGFSATRFQRKLDDQLVDEEAAVKNGISRSCFS
ncbi:hypothetical protein Ancab_027887 [Ancistrocladus abbreviatus]